MSLPPFIVVNKVVGHRDGTMTAESEFIELAKIKSFRDWKKSPAEKEQIEGDITAVYMKSEKKGVKDPVIKIAEPCEKFADRLHQIKIRGEQMAKDMAKEAKNE